MIRSSNPGFVAVTAAVLVAGCCAVLFACGLAALAKPRDFDTRVAALQAQADRTELFLRRRGGQRVYPDGAICPALNGAQAVLAAERLRQAAAAAGLADVVVSAEPDTDRAPESIGPMRVRLTASGSYEGALQALDRLARQTPLIYADAIDLRSKTDAVDLQFSGRFYCWTARSH